MELIDSLEETVKKQDNELKNLKPQIKTIEDKNAKLNANEAKKQSLAIQEAKIIPCENKDSEREKMKRIV